MSIGLYWILHSPEYGERRGVFARLQVHKIEDDPLIRKVIIGLTSISWAAIGQLRMYVQLTCILVPS